MIKKIITFPNPILRKKTATVTKFDEELQTLIEDMTDTMFDAPGAGLAANQIGVSKQVCVINVSNKEEDVMICFCPLCQYAAGVTAALSRPLGLHENL